MVVLYGDVLTALGLDRFSRLAGFVSGNFLHITDAGSVVVNRICILLRAIKTTGDIGDLLGSAVDALIRNGDVTDFDLVGFHAITVDSSIPGFDAAILAQVYILLQGYFQGTIFHRGFDVLVITLDGNRLAQVFLHGAAFFVSQSEAAFVLAGNIRNGLAQLTFRCSPVSHHMASIPLGVIQAFDVVALGRVLVVSLIVLLTDGDLMSRITAIRAYGDGFEIRPVGHDDFQPVFCCVLADAQVAAGYALGISQHFFIINAPFDGQGVIESPGNYVDVVAHEFQAVIESCHYMVFRTALIVCFIIGQAGDAILARLAIHAGDSVFAVGPFGTYCLDDGGHRAVSSVLAGETDLPVFSILTHCGNRLGSHIISQFEGDFTVFCSGDDLIGCAAEGDGFAELVAAFSIVVTLVFQVHSSRHFRSIHGQVIVMAGGIGIICILIHYADRTICRFYGSPASIGNLFHIADIGAIIVASVGIFRTINAAAHVGNLVSRHRNGGLVDDDITLAVFPGVCDFQAVAIHGGIPGLYAGETFQFLGQADFQLTVGGFVCGFRGNDADIAIRSGRQFICIGLAAQDIQLGVELTGHDIAAVAVEFQAVIEGSPLMFLAIRIFVDDAGHGFPILAIDARFARFGPDIHHSVLAVESDMAFGAIHAIHAVFAGDGDAILAVFAFDGNAVFPILTGDGDGLGRQVVRQFERDFTVFRRSDNLAFCAVEGHRILQLAGARARIPAVVQAGFGCQALHVADVGGIVFRIVGIGLVALPIISDFRSPAGHVAHLGIQRIAIGVRCFKGHVGLVYLPVLHIVFHGPVVGFVHLRLGSDVLDGDGLVRILGIIGMFRIPDRQGQFSVGGGIAAVIRIGIPDQLIIRVHQLPVVNGVADHFQLVFRSRPAADVFRIRHTPVLVRKARCIAAFRRMVVFVGSELRIAKGPDSGIPGFQSAVRIQIHMFSQADIELAIGVLHADIVVRQFSRGFSHDIQLLVELLADDFRGIVLAIIAGKFQAVIQSGYGMGRSTRFPVFSILIDNTGNAIGTVDARFPISAIGTIFPNSPDNGSHRTIGAIFTVEADLAILSVFAVDHHRVGCQSLVHEHVNGSIAVCILFNRSYQILAGILVKRLGAGTFNVDCTVQLVAHRVVRLSSCRGIGTEFQAVIQGSHRMGRCARFSVFPILVDNAGDAVSTVDARFSIGAIRTVLADSPDDGSHRAIFAILAFQTNLAVLAIFAVDHYCVSRQGFIQLDGDIAIGIHFGSHVICTVVVAGDGINALDFDCTTHLDIIGFTISRFPGIGIEIQAFVMIHYSFKSGNGHRRIVASRILYLQGHLTLFIDFVDSVAASSRISNQVFFLVQEISQIHVKGDRVAIFIPFVAGNG